MLFEKKHCVKSDKYNLPHGKKKLGLFAGLLLALLPKCPLCFMAFSSTFVLCDEAGTFTETHTHSSPTVLILSALFCGITLVSMFFNYRDTRTKYALLLVLAGSAFILYSVVAGGGLSLYYSGVVCIFFGVWLNGSLLFFVGKLRNFFIKNRGNRIVQFPMIKNRN